VAKNDLIENHSNDRNRKTVDTTKNLKNVRPASGTIGVLPTTNMADRK